MPVPVVAATWVATAAMVPLLASLPPDVGVQFFARRPAGGAPAGPRPGTP